MTIKLFLTIFITVFLAEVGDKTQLATVLFAADRQVSGWWVFAAASLALVCATAIGVVGGQWLSKTVPEHYLRIVAGVGFLAIGAWTLLTAGR